MEYGATETTEILDEQGSRATTAENWREGRPVKPRRVRYEMRTQVKSQAEEHEEYLRFSDELKADHKKLDPAFKIEPAKGKDYYYVVKCYTVLSYE